MKVEKKQVRHKKPVFRCGACNKHVSVVDHIISDICGKCTDKQVKLIKR